VIVSVGYCSLVGFDAFLSNLQKVMVSSFPKMMVSTFPIFVYGGGAFACYDR
jgi:hypothetical protein